MPSMRGTGAGRAITRLEEKPRVQPTPKDQLAYLGKAPETRTDAVAHGRWRTFISVEPLGLLPLMAGFCSALTLPKVPAKGRKPRRGATARLLDQRFGGRERLLGLTPGG